MNFKNPELAAALATDNHDQSHEAVDGAALLDDVCEFLGRFVAYPSEHAKVAHALWVFHYTRYDGLGIHAEAGIPVA